MPKLEIITGSNLQHQFSVEKVGVWIGSDERCDVCLREAGVSKFHAHIMTDPSGNYWVEDAGSSFGTLLNGKDIEQEQLKHNDVLTLGRLKIRFLDSSETPQVTLQAKVEADLHHETPPSITDATAQGQNTPRLTKEAEGETKKVPLLEGSSEASSSPKHPQPTLNSEGCEILSDEDDEEDEEILDGDALELIEEDDFDEEWEEEEAAEEEYSSEFEGTALAPIPLSPEEFQRPIPQQSKHSEDSEEVESQAPDGEGTQLVRIPQAGRPGHPFPHPPIKVTKNSELLKDSSMQVAGDAVQQGASTTPPPQALPASSMALEPPGAYTVNHDQEEDLHGPPAEPRSRTVLFNLEMAKLKFQLEEREKQLVQIQQEAADEQSKTEQQEWLQRTLEMVREDNQRLQYQISAYEEAAEENEELMQKVSSLEKANHALIHENNSLRQALAQYERYYYQQQTGAADGSTS